MTFEIEKFTVEIMSDISTSVEGRNVLKLKVEQDEWEKPEKLPLTHEPTLLPFHFYNIFTFPDNIASLFFATRTKFHYAHIHQHFT